MSIDISKLMDATSKQIEIVRRNDEYAATWSPDVDVQYPDLQNLLEEELVAGRALLRECIHMLKEVFDSAEAVVQLP